MPCTHGGNDSCRKQGGSGSLKHASSYTHPYPTLAEAGEPIGDYIEPVQKSEPRTVDFDLGTFFDDELAETYLNAEVQSIVDPEDIVKKSLYDFDLTSTEGIDRLLALLPILDEDIVKIIVQEIWPGYPVEEEFDPKIHRAEIKGFLLDYLEGHGAA